VLISTAAIAAAGTAGQQQQQQQQQQYLLGVVHYWREAGAPGAHGRSYHHHLVKVQAAPPFAVTAVSVPSSVVSRV
jgi:hypothetical protein